MKHSVYILGMIFGLSLGQELKDFDETVLYGIDFPGDNFLLKEDQNYEEMIVTTDRQERYKCMIPVTETKSEAEKKIDMSKSPLQYLSIMYSKQSCSYRVEAYWTYEICHGHHIKQYHEERDGKQLISQEYYLGKWDDKKNEELKSIIQEDIQNGKKFKTTKIDNANYPYLEVEMSDGTVCDLNNEPRSTKIRYVCYPNRKIEVYSIKETSSCNYEAVVLTTTLCMHPAFVPEESKENAINCLPVEGAPEKPLSWLYNEIDRLKYNPKHLQPSTETSSPTKRVGSLAIIKFNEKGEVIINVVDSDLDQLGLLENLNSDKQKKDKLINGDVSNEEITNTKIKSGSDATSTSEKSIRLTTNPKERAPVIDFLSGKSCLTGGTGWWKFEFCYGKFVRQFHVDRMSETSYILGSYNEEAHKKWIDNHPEKRPKPKDVRTELYHYYNEGSPCDKTGDKRQSEVKLRCPQNSPSSTSVSMYLLEPKTCHYTLVVESQIICEVLQIADDEYGLVSIDKLVSSTGAGESSVGSGGRSNTGRDGKPSEAIYLGNVPVEDLEVRYENN